MPVLTCQACDIGHVKSRLGLGAAKLREQWHSSLQSFAWNSRVILWPEIQAPGSVDERGACQNPYDQDREGLARP